MKLVQVSEQFYRECVIHGTEKELLLNEKGRPCVLILQLYYKGNKHKFVVPLRSNISGKTPKEQFFSLPPNKNTKVGNSHGIHYIKMFPITDKYVNKYLIDKDPFKMMIKGIIDNKDNEREIVKACQAYLKQCEEGKKHPMTPDIDGIMKWL